jgi:hypothetical protein
MVDGNRNAEPAAPTLVYCHCAYSKVVPDEVKKQVLSELCASGVAFEAVADLCEMSARKDPGLQRLAKAAPLKVAACFPRAVTWLFHAAKAPLPKQGVEILNMRTEDADAILGKMLADRVPACEEPK